MSMDYSDKSLGFNKSVFIIALVVGLVLNLLLLGSFQYYVSHSKPDLKIKEPKISYIPEKPKPLPEPKKEKKKIKKEKPKLKTVKKKEQKKTEKIKKIKKPKVSKPKKSTGEKVARQPVIPAVTPPLPESVELKEKDIPLPETELPEGNFVDVPSEKVIIKEFKAVSPGKFNPSFGTEFSKLDANVKGTAKNRKILYRPKPPVIKASVPPPPIKVKLWINPDGTVAKAELLETTGNPEIDRKVKEYILRWKFSKISTNQQQWAVTTIKFKTK